MKNFVMSLIACVAFILAVGLVGGWESKYTRTATISTAAHGNYEATDAGGNIWAFEGGNYAVGQEVKLYMDNNHTTSLYDDVILKVKG